VASPRGASYADNIKSDKEIESIARDVFDKVGALSQEAVNQLETFQSFAMLYMRDVAAQFDDFLADRETLENDELMLRLSLAVTGERLGFQKVSRRFGAAKLYGRKHDLATLVERPSRLPAEAEDEAARVDSRRPAAGSFSGVEGASPAASRSKKRLSGALALSAGEGDEEAALVTLPTLEEFGSCLRVFQATSNKLLAMPETHSISWLALDLTPMRATLRAQASKWQYTFGNFVLRIAEDAIRRLRNHLDATEAGISELREAGSSVSFMRVLNFFHDISARQEEIDAKLGPLNRTLDLLQEYRLRVSETLSDDFRRIPSRLTHLRQRLEEVKRGLAPRISKEGERIKSQLTRYNTRLLKAQEDFLTCSAFRWSCAPEKAKHVLRQHKKDLQQLDHESRDLNQLQQLTSLAIVNFDELRKSKATLAQLEDVRELQKYVMRQLEPFMATMWPNVDMESLHQVTSSSLSLLDSMPSDAAGWDITVGLRDHLNDIKNSVPLLQSLNSKDLRSRHWKKLFRDAGADDTLSDAVVRSWPLKRMLSWLPKRHPHLVHNIVEMAAGDISSEQSLQVRARGDYYVTQPKGGGGHALAHFPDAHFFFLPSHAFYLSLPPRLGL
jgi:hypothetical protein